MNVSPKADLRLSDSRFSELDGLRGIASLTIVVSHLLSAFLPALAFGILDRRVPQLSGLAHTPLAVLWAGDTAVLVFFMHSGFVLTHRWRRDAGASVAAQTVKRVVRLGLPVAIAILLAGTIYRVGAMHNLAAAKVSHSPWLAQFYRDERHPGLLWSAFGGSLLRGAAWWMGPLWSVNVQFFGSLFIFALLALFGRDRRREVVFAVIVAWSLVAGSSRFGIYFAALTIGVWMSVRRPRVASKRGQRVVLMTIGALLAGYFASWPDEEQVGPWYSWLGNRLSFTDNYLRPRAIAHTIAAGLVMWFVLTSPKLQRVLRLPFLRWVGRLSFATYLVHWPILMSLGAWVFLRVADHFHSLYGGFAAASGVVMAATALVAIPFAKVVDGMAIRTSRSLERLWQRPVTVSFSDDEVVGQSTDRPLDSFAVSA